jgi:hypothetical protein
MCELFIGAFFFAMRSCEYLNVSGKRKTKILTIKNIRFFKGRSEVHHSDPALHLATTVSITFEYQKKDTRNDTITQHRSGDKLLCPVRIWAKIVCRILSYPGANQSTQVNAYLSDKKNILHIRGSDLLKRLRQATAAIGKHKLGFTPDQIGLHSARSGAAMAMYLAGVPVFTIMLLGRWSSDAFLRYIRKQVQEFSKGVSNQMITNEDFFTIPSTSKEDPRVSKHPLNHSSRKQNGSLFKGTIQPLLSVFH